MSSLNRQETLELLQRAIEASTEQGIIAFLDKLDLDVVSFLAVLNEHEKGSQAKQPFNLAFGICIGYYLSLAIQEREQLGK